MLTMQTFAEKCRHTIILTSQRIIEESHNVNIKLSQYNLCIKSDYPAEQIFVCKCEYNECLFSIQVWFNSFLNNFSKSTDSANISQDMTSKSRASAYYLAYSPGNVNIVYDINSWIFVQTYMCTVVILFPSSPWPITAVKYFTSANSASISSKRKITSLLYLFQKIMRLVSIPVFPSDLLYTCIVFNAIAYTEPQLIIHILICLLFGEYLCSPQCFPYNSEKCGCRTLATNKTCIYF